MSEINELIRLLQEHMRKVRDVPGRTYPQAAQLLNLKKWDLVEDRWGDIRPPKLIKMAFCAVPEVRDVARRLLNLKGYSEQAIQQAHTNRSGELITYDELRAAQKFQLATKQRASGQMMNGIPAFYTHVALQLEVRDFPCQSLLTALAKPGPSLPEVREALLRELLGAYIDAAYFKAYQGALKRRARGQEALLPVHRCRPIGLNPTIYPEKSLRDDEESIRRGLPPLQWYAQWVHCGRGVQDIFVCSRPDERLADLLDAVKRAEPAGNLYMLLYELTQCDEEDVIVPEPDVVAAAAAMAAFRSTMAVLHAANTAITYAADDPGLATQILPIITQICRLAHFSYLDMAEMVGDTSHKLPQKTSQFRSDYESIGYGYSMTMLNLLSDEGAWSRLDRGDEDKLECYFLSGSGSVICDMQTSKVTFRFVTDNDEVVPRSWGTPPPEEQ